jgi:hypothetical protein
MYLLLLIDQIALRLIQRASGVQQIAPKTTASEQPTTDTAATTGNPDKQQ